MIRIGLVDDDENHLQMVQSFLKRYEKEEGVSFQVEEYRNGLNFVEDYNGALDVVFLDIEMPHMDRMTAARKIREKDQALGIVFVTNMAQCAIRGYEVNAIDFIVKPVSYYVFADKLRKAVRFSKLNTEKDFVVQTEDSIIKITCSQILYVEKNKNYLICHTKKGDYRIRGTMAAMEEKLSGEGFSKCISGCLVNLRYVVRVDKDTVWVGDTPLPISRQRKKEFKEDFMKYLGGGF
ncbi:MAG: LytTR family DNA-binding domain-containing protein [Lachnospiraceae bacterium]|nr:LytTR family DNA-binding domain-containing protein [Lachnospiraceae bacterium]